MKAVTTFNHIGKLLAFWLRNRPWLPAQRAMHTCGRSQQPCTHWSVPSIIIWSHCCAQSIFSPRYRSPFSEPVIRKQFVDAAATNFSIRFQWSLRGESLARERVRSYAQLYSPSSEFFWLMIYSIDTPRTKPKFHSLPVHELVISRSSRW